MLGKRFFTAFAVIAMLVTLPAVALAAGNGNGTDHYGPYTVTGDTDGSPCGGTWNTESFDRSFSVHNNGDGTFLVTEQDKHGVFVTTDGPSPASCTESKPLAHHVGLYGSHLDAGIVGQMSGFWTFDISATNYDPTGCDAVGANCGDRAGFFAAVFPDGTYGQCATVCQWNFEYSSNDSSLISHHWQDRSNVAGTVEYFVGDIATQ